MDEQTRDGTEDRAGRQSRDATRDEAESRRGLNRPDSTDPTYRADPTVGTGERFVCDVCGAEFDSASALHDHLFSVGQVY